MGTIKSNDIVVNTLASPISSKIGDIVTYIIQVTVPMGIVAENIRLQDTFPEATQEFITGSVLINGQPMNVEPVPSGGTITFPVVNRIDATSEEITEIYSFDVRIIDGTESANFIDRQVNNTQLTWNNSASGNTDIVVNAQNSIDITMPFLEVRKFQNNITKNIADTTDEISFSSIDIVTYKISVTNTGLNAAYNISVEDTISSYLSVDISTLSATKGEGKFTGNNFIWNIPILEIGQSAIIQFNITGGNNVPALGDILNIANATYSTNDNGFGKNLTPVSSNSIKMNINNLNLSIEASKNNALVGDTIQYIAIFSVYKGTTLDDVQLKSIIPNSQEYVANSATRQINSNTPEVVVPVISTIPEGQKLVFPKPIIGPGNGIDASRENIIIKYIFSAKVISGMEVYPYTQNETIKASVNWSEGSTNEEINAIVGIILQSSSINVCKEQKNFTTSGDYTIGAISGTIGDTIYYKITVESNGAVGGYNLQLQDVLNNNLDFVDTIAEPSIGTVVKPTGTPGGTLQWNIPALDAGTTAVYEFSVRINDTTSLDSILINSITGQYSSNNLGTKVYDLTSNTLEINTTGIILNVKSPNTIAIGENVEYRVELTIPKDKTIYNLKLSIQLSPGQIYITDSWTSSLGNLGIISINSDSNSIEYIESKTEISATSSSNLTIIYSFQTSTVYVRNSPFSEKQISTVNATWKNSSAGRSVGPAVAIANIEINKPILLLTKSQRNVTKNQTNFSTDLLINASIGEELEYKFNITNNGPGNAYNVAMGDNLPSWLDYISSTNSEIKLSGQWISWKIGIINEGDSVTAVIRVKINNTFPQYPSPNQFYCNFTAVTEDNIYFRPLYSNYVGYNYVPPIVSIYPVDGEGNEVLPAFIEGETINYEIKVVVKKGTIAYSLYINNVSLPVGEQYVPNSLTSTGGVPIASSTPILAFPNEGNVYSAVEDRIITYSFKAIAGGATSSAQERKELETFLYWKMGPSESISQEYGFNYEYETSVKPILTKSHGLSSSNFVDSNIQIELEDLIYYKLEIQNLSTYPIYNVNIVDKLPPNAIIQSLESINLPEKTLIKNEYVANSTKLEVVIQNLTPSEILIITYIARMKGPIIPGKIISSIATATYSISLNSFTEVYGPLVYGPISSNELNATISQDIIEFNKTTTNKEVYWEERMPYDITVKIPKGAQVYDLQVSDQYSEGLDFTGPTYLNGQKISVTVSGGKIYFPLIDQNDATKETILKYTYYCEVTTEENLPPFEKSLENITTLYWGESIGSSTKYTLTSNANVLVKTPNISIEKLQRNKTDNGIFDIKQINVKTGNRLEFKLVITNEGPGVGYNIQCTDVLNDSIRYLSTISNSAGNVYYYSSTRTIGWNINILAANTTAIAIFEVEVIGGISAFAISKNSINVTYHGKNNPSLSTSVIQQKYPPINIQVTSDKSSFLVNDIVTYNILVSVPNGTIFNNLKVQNILPVGQSFVSSKLNNVSINPIVNNQVINFATIPTGTSGNLNYEIKAIVKSVDMSKGMADVQTDSANITWSLDSSDTQIVGPISDTVDVFTSTNLLSVEKLQKVKSSGSFTTSNIEISSGEEVQYKVIITNTGKIKAYNVKIEDILNAKLQYISVDSSTQGSASLQNIGGQNVLVWEGVTELNPSQSVELVYTVRGTSTTTTTVLNQATSKFAIVSGGDELIGTPSNEVSTNILVGDAGLVQVEKLQRIKDVGSFTKNEIEISTGEQVEYKLVITNGAMKTYKIEVQDILNNDFQFESISVSPTKGMAQIQNIDGKNVLVWSDITELDPSEILELVFIVQGTSSTTERVSNQVTSNFAVTPTGNTLVGTPSNKTFVSILVGSEDLVQVQKLQRIKDTGNFSNSDIEVSSGEQIQYKLIVTNGSVQTYKIEIQDMLNNNFEFIGIDTAPSKGTAMLQMVGSDKVLIWDGITQLSPNETLELIFTVKTTSTAIERLSNQTTSSFAMTPTGNSINGMISNEVFVNVLVGDPNFLTINKLQRIKGLGSFSLSDIDISSEEEIQYKLIIINNSAYSIYRVKVEDILNDKLQFISIDNVSVGSATVKSISGQNIVVWEGINKLDSKQAAELIFTVKGVSTTAETIFNQATSEFSMTAAGNILSGEPSNEVLVNILVGDSTLVKLQKFQRIKGIGSFSADNIDVSSEEEIEYKLTITNVGTMNVYNLNIQDILNNKLSFIDISSVSKGVADLQQISGDNVIVWSSIDQLIPKETGELIYTVKAVPTIKDMIPNRATQSFAVTPTGASIAGLPSNEIWANILIGDSSFLNIQKLQRIKGIGDFLTDNLEISNEEEIEYKLIITNVSNVNLYKISIEDILNTKLQFVQVTFITSGDINLQQVDRKNVLVWNKIEKLGSGEKLELIFTLKGISIEGGTVRNQAKGNFAVTSTGATLEALSSNEVIVDILFSGEDLIKVEKFQRIKGIGQFCTNNIKINSGGEIEYKIQITNTGNITAYKINIQDIISDRLEFMGVVLASKGITEVKQVNNDEILVWNEIDKLIPNETEELIYLVKVISSDIENISNQASIDFALTPTGKQLEGLPSNEVFIEILGVRYSFTPDNDSYLSQNKAISYDVIGKNGVIGYILVNNYNIPMSYNLEIGKIPFNYKLYINEIFIEEVESNAEYNKQPEILQNLEANSLNSIKLEYIIPNMDSLIYKEVNFQIMIDLIEYNDFTIINSVIKLGKINLDTSYEVKEDINNKNMFLIKYNANICISKGIKVYDLQLKAIYPPSYIYYSAYKDGIELESSDQNSQVMSKLLMNNKTTEKGKESIIILEGELEFPIIKELDATNEAIQVNYSYILLQYKNTPVSILGLDQNIVKLFFRSSKLQQEKNMIENIIFAQDDKEKLECVYVDKIFGKCAQYYSYKDIEIPILDTYMFSTILFDNPKIINNSLIITTNICGDDFSKVRYTFTIAYTIIYQGCGCLDLGSCSSCSIKEVRGTLVQKDLEVDLYMPMIQDNIYNIITESKVENIVISEDKTKFCVCISVITSSTTKGTVLVNNLETCSITSCCRNK